MRKPYGISGTPWHVERIHNNDPKDTRRHRSRCAFYSTLSKECRKYFGVCVGASHCQYYKERAADLLIPEEKQPSDKPLRTIPDKQKEDKIEFRAVDIRVGSVVTVKSRLYLVTDIKTTHDLHGIYKCRALNTVKRADMMIPASRRVFGNYYFASEDIYEFGFHDISMVKQLPEKANRKTQAFLKASGFQEKQKHGGADEKKQRSNAQKKMGFTVISYEGSVRCVTRSKLTSMYFVSQNGKKIPVLVDQVGNVLYLMDEYQKKNWAPLALGFVIVGLEAE